MEWIEGQATGWSERDRVLRCAERQERNGWKKGWELGVGKAGWLGQKVRHRQTHTHTERERVYRLSVLSGLGVARAMAIRKQNCASMTQIPGDHFCVR